SENVGVKCIGNFCSGCTLTDSILLEVLTCPPIDGREKVENPPCFGRGEDGIQVKPSVQLRLWFMNRF
ncbi:MAG TPA: hypothetical protein ACFYEM_10460, partial [Candidatus Hypogeohydataceae bacterium YC40]